jgi:formylmethanofuran dehydrogenase subunit E
MTIEGLKELQRNIKDKKLDRLIRDAVKLHGHLGPFLVIGVRMGEVAKKVIGDSKVDEANLLVNVKTPQKTPFSCTIDGIQSTTHCTVGNKKLRIEESKKEICCSCRVQNSRKTVKITLNSRVMLDLTRRLSEGVSNEELATRVASMPETELFVIEDFGD